jgi:hypothetical protein
MITKYTKLMEDPALKGLWAPAMSKELHSLAQGKEGVTVGINTIFYLTHDEIRRFPKDCNVTYARIVIKHCPQKDDPNHVCITVGGNLINCLYKLTTRTANVVLQKLCGIVSSVLQERNSGTRTSRTCILKSHSIGTSTSACPSSSFQMTSSTTTIYVKKSSMAMYTWKFGAACTVYHKSASWQTSYYTNAWDNIATSKYNTSPGFPLKTRKNF